jgi:hypothetical protein
MKKEDMNAIITELSEQLLDTAKRTIGQVTEFLEENTVAKEILTDAKEASNNLKSKFPEYSEILTQFVKGQKEVFGELLNPDKSKRDKS